MHHWYLYERSTFPFAQIIVATVLKCWHPTEVLFFLFPSLVQSFFTWIQGSFILWISHHPVSSFPLKIHFNWQDFPFLRLGNLVYWAIYIVQIWAILSAGQSCVLANLRRDTKASTHKASRRKLRLFHTKASTYKASTLWKMDRPSIAAELYRKDIHSK